jgi:hypothetical protein
MVGMEIRRSLAVKSIFELLLKLQTAGTVSERRRRVWRNVVTEAWRRMSIMRECGCRSHQSGGEWERSESESEPRRTELECNGDLRRLVLGVAG